MISSATACCHGAAAAYTVIDEPLRARLCSQTTVGRSRCGARRGMERSVGVTDGIRTRDILDHNQVL